jgi:Ca2+-binding RTX toxin-like protein
MALIFDDDNGNVLTGDLDAPNTIYGNGGDDIITGGNYQDPLAAPNTFSSDQLIGGDGNDTIYGLAGDDYILSDGFSFDTASGDDIIYAGDGNDYMRGGAGVDYFDGGAGIDRVSLFHLNATQGAIASLLTGKISNDGFGNTETMVNVENLGQGTAYADRFTGDHNDNFFLADIGDMILMMGGDDTVQLSAAPSLLHGGAGVDGITSFISQSWVPDTDGDGFAETVTTTSGVIVDLSIKRIVDDGFGNSGKLISIENVGGSIYDDTLIGDKGDNVLTGHDGADMLTGGKGNDTFAYENATNSGPLGTGTDIITDFDASDDSIDLSGLADEVAGGGALSFAAAFTGIAGEVVVTATAGGALVEADLDGDLVSDFAIDVMGDVPLASNIVF